MPEPNPELEMQALRDENDSLRQECQELRTAIREGDPAQAFAAKEAINAGQWDRHLDILAGAIKLRQRQIAQ